MMLTHADGSPATFEGAQLLDTAGRSTTWGGLVERNAAYWEAYYTREEKVVMCRERVNYPPWSTWCERYVIEGTDRCPDHQFRRSTRAHTMRVR